MYKKSIICTLFEKNHHHGVAGLINSIFNNNFRGDIFVGFRGPLPIWVLEKARQLALPEWENNVLLLEIEKDFRIFFLEIDIKRHLAHYKPRFMLKLMENIVPDAQRVVYFDSDIVIKSNWSFFNDWIDLGVAMVHEIVLNDMPPSHPTRKKWTNVIVDSGHTITNKLHSYLNCGFCGIKREDLSFLYLWDSYITTAIKDYNQDETLFSTLDRSALFWSLDQDTFNMAAMSTEVEISEVGPEGMDFIYGGSIMSHATGTPKPWNKNYLLSLLKGSIPTLADKAYWENSLSPLIIYPNTVIRRKSISIKIASFLGRFYSKK